MLIVFIKKIKSDKTEMLLQTLGIRIWYAWNDKILNLRLEDPLDRHIRRGILY